MDVQDLIVGAAAYAGLKSIESAGGWGHIDDKQRQDREIEKQTGMCVPEFETIEGCKPIWCEQAGQTLGKCLNALTDLQYEINYLRRETRMVTFPISTTKECFLPPRRLQMKVGWGDAADLYEIHYLGASVITRVLIGGGGSEREFSPEILDKIHDNVQRFRKQFWIVNVDRFKQWSKKYLESVHRRNDYSRMVQDFNRDLAIWVDSPAVTEVKRTPSEIAYFDKVFDRIMEISKQGVRAGYDWYMTACSKMPSDEFMNEHGMLSINQYKELRSRI